MYPISGGRADAAEWCPPNGIAVRPADTAALVALAVELMMEYAALPHTAGRWTSIARALVTHAIAAGCEAIRLDTAPELRAAQALYRRLGFVVIPPYHAAMYADVICFELRMRRD